MAGERPKEPPQGQVLIYLDGGLNLQVRLDGQTVWLPQRLIAELFQVSVKTANEHLVNIYHEGELDREATIRSFRIIQREGSRTLSWRTTRSPASPAPITRGAVRRRPAVTQTSPASARASASRRSASTATFSPPTGRWEPRR